MALMKARLVLGVLALLLLVTVLWMARYQGVRFARACEGVVLGINTNSLSSLFRGQPDDSYSVGQSGIQVVVYSAPWLSRSAHTTPHVLTNSQAFPLRHGAMAILVDSSGNVVAYQRINESALVYDRGAASFGGVPEVRTLRDLLDALLAKR